MIQKMATLHVIEHDDGSIQAIITSHPDGNEIEEMLKATLDAMNMMIKAAQHENKEQSK